MNKHRVLVVDDEPTLSDLVRLHLERSKRVEVRVENGSGCAVAVAREFRSHIVLLDVEMPGMNGGEVARELEADPETPGHARVVLYLIDSARGSGRAGDGARRNAVSRQTG